MTFISKLKFTILKVTKYHFCKIQCQTFKMVYYWLVQESLFIYVALKPSKHHVQYFLIFPERLDLHGMWAGRSQLLWRLGSSSHSFLALQFMSCRTASLIKSHSCWKDGKGSSRPYQSAAGSALQLASGWLVDKHSYRCMHDHQVISLNWKYMRTNFLKGLFYLVSVICWTYMQTSQKEQSE